MQQLGREQANWSSVNQGLPLWLEFNKHLSIYVWPNRGKILPSGLIIRKYLPPNCLLVSLLYKTDNEMNLNDCDRGTAQRWLAKPSKCRAPVRSENNCGIDKLLWRAWDQDTLIGHLSIWFGNNNWDPLKLSLFSFIWIITTNTIKKENVERRWHQDHSSLSRFVFVPLKGTEGRGHSLENIILKWVDCVLEWF